MRAASQEVVHTISFFLRGNSGVDTWEIPDFPIPPAGAVHLRPGNGIRSDRHGPNPRRRRGTRLTSW